MIENVLILTLVYCLRYSYATLCYLLFPFALLFPFSSIDDNPAASTSSPRSPRARARKKGNVRLGCYYRSLLENNFNPVIPDCEIAMGQNLKHLLYMNIINGHSASVKSGPYASNNAKLFVAAISSLINEDLMLSKWCKNCQKKKVKSIFLFFLGPHESHQWFDQEK